MTTFAIPIYCRHLNDVHGMCVLQNQLERIAQGRNEQFLEGTRHLNVGSSRPRVTTTVAAPNYRWKKITRKISSCRRRYPAIIGTIEYIILSTYKCVVDIQAARAGDEGESVGETEIMYRDNTYFIRSVRSVWKKHWPEGRENRGGTTMV